FLIPSCLNIQHIDSSTSPVISAIMFGAGIFGNVAALVILDIRRRRENKMNGNRRRALFHVLIIALVVTDLTGTCLVSPLVQLSYSKNTTLVGFTPESRSVCSYFGLSMTFFSLATMSLLFTMALERCLAIGYPYLYSRYVTRKCAYFIIPTVFFLSALFCLLPFTGFGKYVQYCPGTWCFIDMNPEHKKDRVYANLYATVMLVLVLAIVACNLFVVYQLFRMYQRRRRNGSVVAPTRSKSERRALSMAEEVEHLILLVFMTIIFIICTMPLFGLGFVPVWSQFGLSLADLVALRFISINSIIDPWVFIFFSPSVMHFCLASVCRTPRGFTRGSIFKLSLSQKNSVVQQDLTQPTLKYTEDLTCPTAETL
uniref:Prostaglandin E2 receptor EP2 subtype n=1 Tax=Periophthalmus magnuspinnatus TaxID=409849 RepID=A0A3B4AC72_9GOBI